MYSRLQRSSKNRWTLLKRLHMSSNISNLVQTRSIWSERFLFCSHNTLQDTIIAEELRLQASVLILKGAVLFSHFFSGSNLHAYHLYDSQGVKGYRSRYLTSSKRPMHTLSSQIRTSSILPPHHSCDPLPGLPFTPRENPKIEQNRAMHGEGPIHLVKSSCGKRLSGVDRYVHVFIRSCFI